MLSVSLSALNAHELRRALALARSRNQQRFAEAILAELAARATYRPPDPIRFEPDQPVGSPPADEPEGGHWIDLPEGRRYVLDAPPPSGGYRLSRPHLLRR